METVVSKTIIRAGASLRKDNTIRKNNRGTFGEAFLAYPISREEDGEDVVVGGVVDKSLDFAPYVVKVGKDAASSDQNAPPANPPAQPGGGPAPGGFPVRNDAGAGAAGAPFFQVLGGPGVGDVALAPPAVVGSPMSDVVVEAAASPGDDIRMLTPPAISPADSDASMPGASPAAAAPAAAPRPVLPAAHDGNVPGRNEHTPLPTKLSGFREYCALRRAASNPHFVRVFGFLEVPAGWRLLLERGWPLPKREDLTDVRKRMLLAQMLAGTVHLHSHARLAHVFGRRILMGGRTWKSVIFWLGMRRHGRIFDQGQ